MRFETEVIVVVKCDGPGCDGTDRQPQSGMAATFPAQPSVPKGWFVLQQDGTHVFCTVSCVREWLGHWTVYRGGDLDPNGEAVELRDLWFSLRANQRGPCLVHGLGCEYDHREERT